MKVRGIINGKTFWYRGDSWVTNESEADTLLPHEAERRLRIINANNRFLDREDQIEASYVESN